MINNISEKIKLLNQTTLESLNEKNDFDIIKNFTETGLSILKADFAFAWWRRREKESFHLVYKTANTPYQPNLPRRKGGNYEAQKKREPVFVNVVKKRNYAQQYDVSPYMKSYVIVPICYKKHMYGNLVLCFKKVHKFSGEEKSLGQALGNAAAQAITIHRLVESERQALAKVEYHERRFRTLIENSYDAIIIIDPMGNMQYVSPSAKRILGYELNELTGHNVSEFLHQEDIPVVKERIKETLGSTEQSFVNEFRYRHKNGGWRWLESTSTNMLHNPSVGGIVSNIRDVTERKKVEEQEKALIGQKEEFLRIASHELKTPITVIKGFTTLLQMQMDKSKKVDRSKNYIHKISYNIEKINRLVSDFLDISSINAGKIKFKSSKFELTGFVKDKISDLKMVVPEHKLRLEPIKKQFWVTGDMERIGQVINNLVTNAAKYSPSGSKILVRLTQQDNRHIKLEVEDFGIGIPEKYRDKIFKRFFQAKKQAGVYQGLGLGLYISSLIVSHHGGALRFMSKDQGTIFYFTLPFSNEKK